MRTLKDIVTSSRFWYLRPIDSDPPIDPGGGDPGGGGTGGGGTGDPGGGVVPGLPGLGVNLRKRYTSNLAVIDEMSVLDLLNEVILPACRGFITQGDNGKLRLHNKKPADFAFGIDEFFIADTDIDVDNAQPWVDSNKYFIIVDPHTSLSEVRQVTAAIYPTSQNSITLVSDTPAEVVVTAFSGADGASTPATATITTTAAVDASNYVLTIDGIDLAFTAAGTADSMAAFLASAINAHPKLNRKFSASQVSGDEFCTITARNGTLTLDSALTNDHPAPVADPTVAPTLAAAGSGGSLLAGEYLVGYTYRNVRGQTLLSPFKAITITAGQHIDVSAVTPPAGCTVAWYCSPQNDSSKLRFLSENDGSGFTIDWPLGKLSASRPPALNRTGTEIMRVVAVFSDRREPRSSTLRANVLMGSFKWLLGNRRKAINRVDLEYREANQDFRLIELRVRDDAHIAKINKVNNEKVNGQAIDNYFQAIRIATSMLAEFRDADFFYEWQATSRAMLIEENDIVCITDSGSGVYNLPVSIQEINVNPGRGGRPKVSFTGQKYFSTLWDDSPNDIAVPIVSEIP